MSKYYVFGKNDPNQPMLKLFEEDNNGVAELIGSAYKRNTKSYNYLVKYINDLPKDDVIYRNGDPSNQYFYDSEAKMYSAKTLDMNKVSYLKDKANTLKEKLDEYIRFNILDRLVIMQRSFKVNVDPKLCKNNTDRLFREALRFECMVNEYMDPLAYTIDRLNRQIGDYLEEAENNLKNNSCTINLNKAYETINELKTHLSSNEVQIHRYEGRLDCFVNCLDYAIDIDKYYLSTLYKLYRTDSTKFPYLTKIREEREAFRKIQAMVSNTSKAFHEKYEVIKNIERDITYLEHLAFKITTKHHRMMEKTNERNTVQSVTITHITSNSNFTEEVNRCKYISYSNSSLLQIADAYVESLDDPDFNYNCGRSFFKNYSMNNF